MPVALLFALLTNAFTIGYVWLEFKQYAMVLPEEVFCKGLLPGADGPRWTRSVN
jgi:hypothetical protein